MKLFSNSTLSHPTYKLLWVTSQNYISPTTRKNREKGKSSVSQVVSRFSPSKCHITKIAQQCKLCLPLRTLRHKIALPPGVANLFSSPCFWRLFQAFGLKCILILVLVCCTLSRSKPGLSICELQYNEILSFTTKSFHLSHHMLCYGLQLPTQTWVLILRRAQFSHNDAGCI